MRRFKSVSIFMLVVFAVAALALVGGCSKKPVPKPLPEQPPAPTEPATPAPQTTRMIIGYFVDPGTGAPDKTSSFPSMKTFARSMTHVAPFWYKVTADGTLDMRDSQLVYDTARQLGVQMFPVVTFNNNSPESVLPDPALRTKVTDNIAKVVQDRPYEGINIRFAGLKPEQQQNLTAFMAELYPKLKAINKTVIVSVPSKIDMPEAVHGAYNYAELAKNADFVEVMLFDQHSPATEPGALAPLDWYERNLQHAIEQVGAAQKVIAGIGVYGYDWAKPGEAYTLKYVDAIVLGQKQGADILYDEQIQAPHFKYQEHEVWYENQKSTAAKLDVVAKYNPAGIAIWRLGQEQPEIWPIIEQKFPKP